MSPHRRRTARACTRTPRLPCPRGPPASTWPRGCGTAQSPSPPRPRARRLEHLHQTVSDWSPCTPAWYSRSLLERKRPSKSHCGAHQHRSGSHLPQGGSEKYPLCRGRTQSPHCHGDCCTSWCNMAGTGAGPDSPGRRLARPAAPAPAPKRTSCVALPCGSRYRFVIKS